MGGQDAHPTIQFTLVRFICKFFMGGQDAHPTIQFTLCGTGILPVLENGATY